MKFSELAPSLTGKAARDFLRGVSRPPLAAALLGMALLAACKEDDAQGNNSAAIPAQMEALLEEVKAGEAQLTLSGAVNSPGGYTTGEAGRYAGRGEDVYQPARGGRADHARRGNNAEGPYMFRIHTDAIHQKDEDDTVRAWITVVLPEGAGPGSYVMAAGADAEAGEAQAALEGDGYAWRFSREVEGSLHLAELGEHLTAAWDFVAQDRSGEAVEISGGVRKLEFTPQPEGQFVLSANGETVEHFGRVSAHGGDGKTTLIPGSGIYLDIPAGIEAGTYPIRNRSKDETDAIVTLSNYGYDTANGELVLEHEAGYFSGTYRVTTSGEDKVNLEGSFNHVILAD